jgi:hypothetical protein
MEKHIDEETYLGWVKDQSRVSLLFYSYFLC